MNTSDAALPPLPLSVSSFKRLRELGMLYVDKTELICRLAQIPAKFFLARPRRFGKSLLISTLAALFDSGTLFFTGLAAAKLWHDKTYNVVRIDFSEVKNFQTLESFISRLHSRLAVFFEEAGFRFYPESSNDFMAQLSSWMKKQPIASLVLLIDEYDAPLTACLNNPALFESVRSELNNFYALIKSNDECLRFVFVTGITKFNHTGIFSELNDLTDISLFPEFGAIVGYTERDIDNCFGGYIRQAALALNLPEAVVRNRLRDNYDGYCFDDAASVHVYSTWSTLTFFSYPSRGFKNYWMGSGGKLTLLQQYLHNHALQAPEDYANEKELSYDDLASSSDIDNINDVALLTQAGYLTIKRFNEDSYYVGYPNKEVADSLAKLYRNQLLQNQSMDKVGAGDLASAIRTGDVDRLFTAANHAFAAIDYQRHPIREEKHCQAFLQIFIAGAGFSVQSETHDALGRSDLEFDADNVHWVLELKYLSKGQSTAEVLLSDASQQIEKCRYGDASPRRLVRAAAVFSEASRQFCCWKDVAATDASRQTMNALEPR